MASSDMPTPARRCVRPTRPSPPSSRARWPMNYLLKRDGGFVRPGYEAALDETRALRDESRRVGRRVAGALRR